MARDGFNNRKLLSERGEDILNRRSERIRERTRLESRNLDQISRDMAEIDKITNDINISLEKRLERISQLGASIKELKRANYNLQQQGMADINRQHQAARGMAGTAIDNMSRAQLREDVVAGRVDRTETEKNLAKITERLIDSFNKLDKAVSSNANNAGKLADEFGNVAKEYDHHIDTLRELDRHGGGGRSGLTMMGGIGAFGQTMQGVGGMFNAYAQYQQFSNVQAPMQDIQNRISFGQMANARFKDQYGAAQGDATALRRVLSDSFGDAMRDSVGIGQAQRDVLSTQLKGSAAEGIGSLLSSAGSIVPAGKLTKMAKGVQTGANIAQAGGGAAASLAQTANISTDIDMQLSQAQVVAQRFNQLRQMQDVMSEIDDTTGQRTLDTFKGMTISTRGLGVGGGGIGGARSFSGSGMSGAVRRGRVTTPVNELTGGPLFGPGSTDRMRARAYSAVDKMRQDQADEMGLSVEDYKAYNAGRRQEDPGALTRLKEFIVGPSDEAVQSRVARGRESILRKDGLSRYSTPLQSGPSGITTQGGGGGGDRENALSALTDPAFLSQLAEKGLGQKDLPKVVSAAVSGLGKEFAKDLEGTLSRAASTSQVGYFQSPDQYIQARTALSGVGGSSEDLERIMREAVAAGMDSSKNIMEMVQATQSLSQRSAAMGIQSTVGAANMIGRGVQSLQHLPENMRTSAALHAGQFVDSMASDTGLNLGNVIESGRLRQAFGDRANFSELEVMRRLSASQIGQITQGFQQGGAQGRKAAEQFGLGGLIQSAEDARQLSGAVRAGTEFNISGVGIDPRGEQLQAKKRRGERLSSSDQQYLQGYQRRIGMIKGVSGEAAFAMSDMDSSAQQGALRQAPGGLVGGGEQALAAGGIADAQLFKDGVAQFTTAVGGLEAVGNTLATIARNLDPKSLSGQTQQSMESLTAPISTFSGTMKDLNVNMKDLVEELGVLVGEMKRNRGNSSSSLRSGFTNAPIGGDQ